MLGLGLALSVGKKLLSDAIGRLIQKLSIRGTYSENLIDTRNIITDIDDADVLDKATILLTPTAYSDALVHSVKDNTSDSDFDFDRASSATRINSSGLVQDMQSITDPELVLNGDFEELGDDLVTNGDFDTDSDWITGDAWDIENGKAVAISGVSGKIRQTNTLNGKYVKVTLTVSNYGGTGLLLVDFGSVNSPYITSNGTHTFYGTYDQNDFEIYKSSPFTGSIDNVSVKQVDPNDRWSLDTGWSIEDGVAVSDGTNNADILQSGSVVGKTYKLTFTITENNAGRLSVYIGGLYVGHTGTGNSGDFTFYGVASDTTLIRFRSALDFDGSIDNISVKDITFSTDVDLARINYDSNGDNGHILLEPTSTNLFTYSEDFSEWNNSNTTDAISTINSPDGTQNATTITASGSGVLNHIITSDDFTIASGDITGSIFAKKGTVDYLRLRFDGTTSNERAWYNLNNGTIEGEDSSGSAKIEDYGNGWYRCILTSSNNTASGNCGLQVFIQDSGGTQTSWEADGTENIHIWGGQVEQLEYATSYIPTLTGSTVTRATETLTGSGNSTLINSTEGVLYAEIAALANDGTFREITLNDGSTNNVVEIRYKSTANQFQFVVRNGGAAVVSPTITLTNPLEFIKVAFSYKTNDYKMYINGVEVATDTSGTMPSGLNNLSFDWGGTNPFYGKCKALAVFNEALSDAELQNLTS